MIVPRPSLGEALGGVDLDDGSVALALGVDAEASPWYVRALIGGGAWIASLFLTGFLGFALDLEEGGLTVAGVVLMVGSWLLRHGSDLGESDFFGQLSLAGSLTGQLAFIVGIAELLDEVTITALAVFLLEIVLFAVWRDWVHRFLSIVGMWSALMVLVFEHDGGGDILALAMVVQTGGLLLARPRALGAGLAPATWGTVLSLYGWLTLSGYETDVSVLSAGWPTTAGVAVAAAALIVHLFGELGRKPASPPVVIALVALGAVAVLTMNAPGVVTASAVLAIAFRRRDPVLVYVTWAFAGAYVGLWYYGLDVTLLEKSAALASGGIVLLLLTVLVRRPAPAPAEAP